MTTTEIKKALLNGQEFYNEVADYHFCLRADGQMVAFINDNYERFTDLDKLAKRILKALNTGC